MKTIFLSVIIFFMSVALLRAQEGFRINGKSLNVPAGKLILLVKQMQGVDTLASCNMTDGVFVLEGRVETPCVAMLEMVGQQGTIPLMLENTEMKVDIGTNGVYVTGGEAQEVYNQYSEMMREGSLALRKLMGEIKEVSMMQNQAKVAMLNGQVQKLQKETMEKELEWIKKNGNHFVAAFLVQSIAGQRGVPFEYVKERYNLLGPDARASFHGQLLSGYMEMQLKTDVGVIAPDFTVTTPEGNPISLSDIKGKVKLIDFWASWCNPCRAENKNVVDIYKKYHKKGLEIFSVSMDENEADWKKAIKADGLNWHHGSDLKGRQKSEVAHLYFVTAIPHTLLLDENNRIVAKDLRGEALKKKIAEMLKK